MSPLSLADLLERLQRYLCGERSVVHENFHSAVAFVDVSDASFYAGLVGDVAIDALDRRRLVRLHAPADVETHDSCALVCKLFRKRCPDACCRARDERDPSFHAHDRASSGKKPL